jgi:hypothetical protein
MTNMPSILVIILKDELFSKVRYCSKVTDEQKRFFLAMLSQRLRLCSKVSDAQ